MDSDIIGPDVLDIEIASDFPKMLFNKLAASAINGGKLSSDPTRTDIDFRQSTYVRDVFSEVSTSPKQEAPTAGSTNGNPSSNQRSLQGFHDTIFGKSGADGSYAYINQYLKSIKSNGVPLTGFNDTVPNQVYDAITQLYSIPRPLTKIEAINFQNQFAKFKTDLGLNPVQMSTITKLVTLRIKALINNYKNAEIENIKYIQQYLSGNANPAIVDVGFQGKINTLIDALKTNVEKNRQELLASITSAENQAITQTQTNQEKAIQDLNAAATSAQSLP